MTKETDNIQGWVPMHIQIRGRIGLLTEEEVAEVLLLGSTGTLATWRSQKKGPAYVKLGKRVFYTINDLSIWVTEVHKAQVAAAEATVAA